MTRPAIFVACIIPTLIGCASTPTPSALDGGAPKTLPHVDDRIETWTGKTIMIVAPHPDDDTFGCGGTMARLAANGNKVVIIIYTDDDKGSSDPDMTAQRLTKIRKAEEENACAILGIPKENITWLGHKDGMLEYVDAKTLTKQIAREIRRHKPDALFSIDPGQNFKRWHKSDHNAAAFITVDAIRAARWRLYFPELEKDENLKAHSVPICYMYYTSQANYAVDIHDVADKKMLAAAAHESQWDPYLEKFAPMTDDVRQKLLKALGDRAPKRSNRIVEYFRRAQY